MEGTVTNADGIIFLLSWLVYTVASLRDNVSSPHTVLKLFDGCILYPVWQYG